MSIADILDREIKLLRNRALRAEADLESAMENVKSAEKAATRYATRATLVEYELNRAHQVLDDSCLMSARRHSHMGLATRVGRLVAMVNSVNVIHAGGLKSLSTEAFHMLCGAHTKLGVAFPPDLQAEFDRRFPKS